MNQVLPFAAIADDLTGGTDLAGMLHEGGMRVLQYFGLPPGPMQSSEIDDAEAIVVSLKSRSIPVQSAVQISQAAFQRLEHLHPRQIQFKYCSTFDSTRDGNIGPVTDALMTALNQSFTVAVPALPVNGRTQYRGHLFVHGRLLSESALRNHPLNPMDDPNLVRHLQYQTARRVGLVPLETVVQGPQAISRCFEELKTSGIEISLVDAMTEDDVASITEACLPLRLITGGSGFGRHLPALLGCHAQRAAAPLPEAPRNGRVMILSGSCSETTLMQLETWEGSGGAVIRCRTPSDVLIALDSAASLLQQSIPVAIASSSNAEMRSHSTSQAADFEQAFAEVAHLAVHELGVDSLIVAGGETSGAVVEALGIHSGRVLGIVAPGVPSMISVDPPGMFFVLKSGNFGGPGFFADALQHRSNQVGKSVRIGK